MIGLLLLIIGLLLSIWFFSKYKDIKKISDLMSSTQTSSIENLVDGPTEICGIVSKCESPSISPWGKQKCVYYNFHVEIDREGEESNYWETYVSDEKTNPFFIEDSTGRVIVDTSNVEFVLKADKFSKSGGFLFGNEPDPYLEQLLHSKYGRKTRGFIFNKKLRYTETTLELGENVYIFGDATRLGDNWIMKDGVMPLIISDKGGAVIENKHTRQVTKNLILTFLFAIAGLASFLIQIFL